MAYVRQAKVDRNKKIIIVVSVLIILVIALYVGMTLADDTGQKEQNTDFPSRVEQAKQVSLLRANIKIQAGEPADISKFETVTVPKELVPDTAVTTIQFLKGKRVTGNLEKGEFLLQGDLVDSNVWYEEGDRLMEHTFQDGVIPATVDIGSVVDIKLFRQGAEDVVVVSKIAVIGKAQNTLSFYLNSTEQEYLKEANTEGQLFLVQYLDKVQAASITTYNPSYGKGRTSAGGTEDFAASNMIKNN